MNNKEVSLIHYLYVIVKWRKFLLINFFVVCLIAGTLCFIVPKSYVANTTILPPQEKPGGLGLSSILSNLPIGGFAMGLAGLSDEINTFLAILNSRTVMEAVAQKFDLTKRFKTRNMEETIRQLAGYVTIDLNDEGTLTLGAKAKTPFLASNEQKDEARKLARDMANFFIEELDRVNTQLKVEKARNTRIFIEKRYHQNLEDIHQTEEAFKQFQQKYGAIALPEQTEAAITAAAEVKAAVIAKEVEIGVLKKYVNDTHPDLIRAQNELHELQLKYDEFKYGAKFDKNHPNSNQTKDFFLPFKDVPDIGLQYLRLFREVKMQEKILEFLLPEYEQAKIQEAKDTPSVQVLDKAVIPIRKASPKTMLTTLVAGFSCLIICLFFIFTVEYFKKIEQGDDERSAMMTKIRETLRKDLLGFKKNNRE